MDRRFPGRILASIWRVPRALGDGAAAFWRGLSLSARRRLAAALAAAVALIAFFALAVPNLPCQLPGGDSCPPPDDAEQLVPADALAYVHANLDPGTQEFERATEVGSRVPVLGGQIADRALAQLPKPVGDSFSFERDVRPWFGGEAAIAILPGSGGKPERVVLLEADDAEGATGFAQKISVGVGATQSIDGVDVSIDDGGVATAQADGFLVIGERAGVSAVLDTATGAGKTGSLANDDTAREVRDLLPEHRFAEVYLSAAGVGELVAGASGTLSSLTPLLAPAATRGAAASLTADEDGAVELAVRSALDPDKAQASPGFFAAFPRFEPQLPERLPAGSLAYLGIGEPRTAVGALLSQASAEAPGVAKAFQGLAESLSSEIDIEHDLLDALGGEAAFAVEPQPVDAGPAPPFLEFVAAGVDEDKARRALAALQGPLAQSVSPGSVGQAPVFGEQQIEGVDARSLRISPALELTYAVFDGLAVIATDPAGVAELAGGGDSLAESDAYDRATEGFADEVSLLAYLDLGELVALGEQLGLAEDPLYATFAHDFRRLGALGLAVSADDELLATDARLLVTESESGPAPAGSSPD